MIVCQYFLQGRCRFGQNCRFEHSYNNVADDKNSRNSLNAQQLHDVLRCITEEVMMAEKGGQWPLSCFAPLRGKPNFPGFEDISPEELRWKTYQAKANGTWDQCLNEIKELYQNVERMRNRIMTPTKETLTLLVNVLKSKKEPSPLSQNSTATQQTGQNVFGTPTQPTPTQNIFGGSTQGNQNIFGNVTQSTTNQNVFGTPTQSTPQNVMGMQSTNSGNIFGGSTSPTTPPMPQGSIFGSSSFSTNVFGNTQSTGNVFGGSPTLGNAFKGSQNIFGGSATTTQANVFSNANTSFSNQNIFRNSFSQTPFSNQGTMTQNIFMSPGTTSGSVFSSAPPQNVFSNFAQGGSQTTGVFQSQSSTFSQNNPFQSSTQNQNQSTVQSENIFKSQNTFGGNVFGGQQGPEAQKLNAMDSSVYSKVDDLTEEEVNAFKNTIFSFGKIPLKPPPQELCK